MSRSQYVKPFLVRSGKGFRLSKYDPAATCGLESKEAAGALLRKGIERLSKLQERLYADNTWALLLIFQAMDAAGKDSAIKHVFSGLNPQGCQVYSFKQPSTEELDHDFLWRAMRVMPERGRIGIFNRSYYEEVLVVRVHPELLERQKLPQDLVSKNIWEQRYEDIGCMERYLTRNGIAIRKFFLNVSKEEQRQRFLSRLEDPAKNWKFSAADLHERDHWDDYMDAYEKMIASTSSDEAPWLVVPADHKWVTRLVIAEAIIEALESMDLKFPTPPPQDRKALELARRQLEKRDK